MSSKADEIRGFALVHHVLPWRRSGEKRLSIRTGDVVRSMGLQNATPNVCSALGSQKFLQEAGLMLVHREGPQASTTTTFHYESAGVSSNQSVYPEAASTAWGSGQELHLDRMQQERACGSPAAT